MFNSDPSGLQDQGSDRTKLKKKTKRKKRKTTSAAICIVNIRPDMMHASVHICVWPTELHIRKLFTEDLALFSEICNVWCIKGMGGVV